MKDKERILMMIISKIIPGIMTPNREDYFKLCILESPDLKPGDLVLANTTLSPNAFMVGWVHEVQKDCVVIREIGSQKLCNYCNETFSIINKEKLGYEILEGVQYTIYQKVLKAFSKYTDYSTRFQSIKFSGNTCTVTSRNIFENDKSIEISFEYSKKTRASDIGVFLKEAGL